MENHLKQGCKQCQEAVSVWQRVQESAAAEENYRPPAETLRIVKTAFAGAGLQGKDKNPYETQDSHLGRDNPNASSSVPAA